MAAFLTELIVACAEARPPIQKNLYLLAFFTRKNRSIFFHIKFYDIPTKESQGVASYFDAPLRQHKSLIWNRPMREGRLISWNGADLLQHRYNSRRQRVLKGHSPDRGLSEQLKAKPELAKPATKPPDRVRDRKPLK